MGLTKQYLRFVPGPIFGVIASPTANISFITFRDKVSLVAVAACENILIWNHRTNECVFTLKGDEHSVTCFINDPIRNTLAVGYANGSIRVFSLSTGELLVLFSGHKSTLSCLALSEGSLRLASGGKDTEVVLWDLVGETGLFRLKGHKGPITSCHFLEDQNVLITSSEDTLLKLWNLDNQHCFKTLVINKGEVWDFIVLNDQRLIIGGSNENMQVLDILFQDLTSVNHHTDPDGNESDGVTFVEVGEIATPSEKKITSIGVDSTNRLLACHGYSRRLMLYRLLSHKEALKKANKRNKKEQKLSGEVNSIQESDEIDIALSDEIYKMSPIETPKKIVNFDITTIQDKAKIAVLLNDNSFLIYALDLSIKNAEALLMNSVTTSGHRRVVNTVSFSSDNLSLLSASNESIKVWNQESQKCTHTFECDMASSSLFITGNDHFLIGTQSGHLKLFELSSQQMLETVNGHSGPVSTIVGSPDERSVASGSGDKDVKFWDYELIKDENYSESKKRLSLVNIRTLKMTEEILCLKYSPNQKFIAVSLLDFTVKVLFCDTLKFAFSLYGHKLPVSCMDISYDSTLLVTGSKDRNMKIWSLEFGSCVKSIFAHEESITCLQFLPKTHMVFSAGKDKKVKQWDCDNFQKIVTLEGHQGEISAMTISPDGTCVVTASRDRSLRFWEKTDEPLILSEEQENEREKEMDLQLANNEPVITGENNQEVGIATKTTIETLKSAEQLIETIDIFKSVVEILEEHKLECKVTKKDLPLPALHPMLMAYKTNCPYTFMLKILCKVRSSNLEETLLHLPFNYVIDFLKILSEFATRKWELELSTRCILFLVRVNLGQISLCSELFPIIQSLKETLISGLSDMRDNVGFNLAGLKFVQRQIETSEDVTLFKDASQKLKRKRKKRNLIMNL